jgi:hypothetical protein
MPEKKIIFKPDGDFPLVPQSLTDELSGINLRGI